MRISRLPAVPVLWLALLAMAALTTCAAHKNALRLGGGNRLPLNDMARMTAAKACVQRFEYERGERRFHFNGHVEMERGRLAIVGLTPVGSRGFAAVYSGETLDYEHLPFYRLPLEPGELLAAYQVMFLATEDLERHLAGHGLRLVEHGQPKPRRELYAGKTPVATVRYSHPDRWRGTAELWVPRRGYRLRVITKLVEDLPPIE